MEQRLYQAAAGNRVGEVAALLRDCPELDVSWANESYRGFTALHVASEKGHTEVVKLLLAHPRICTNSRSVRGITPINRACWMGITSVVRMLLEDHRVDASLSQDTGHTPLWWASVFGYHEIVKCLIASGKNLGDINRRGQVSGVEFAVLEAAIGQKETEVVSLLERFVANPEQTRYEVCRELGVLPAVAAAHFATIVFLCDGLLRVRKSEEKESVAARFFTIAQRLPMELQMTLANRSVGSMKDSVLSRDSEPAFRELAKSSLLS